MARLANSSVGLMARTVSRQDEDIDLYFHTRRTIDQLLDALRRELIFMRDGDGDAVPPCVLFDYEKVDQSRAIN